MLNAYKTLNAFKLLKGHAGLTLSVSVSNKEEENRNKIGAEFIGCECCRCLPKTFNGIFT
jgi:hypothetical protein